MGGSTDNPSRRRIGWRTGLAGLAAAALVGEGATRVAFAVTGDVPPHADRSVELEWEWAGPIVAASEYAPGEGSTFHPLLGYRMSAHRDEAGVRTNSAGFRDAREFDLEPPPGARRIVLVGDSYTWGHGVANDETWGAFLERRLDGWQVLNLGVPGYGVDQAVLTFEEIGADYGPDVVVLGCFVRDVFRNLVAFRGYQKPCFVLGPGDELELRTGHLVPPDELSAAYLNGERRIGGWSYSYLWSWMRSSYARSPFARRSLSADSPAMRLMAALLRRFAEHARSRGSEPFLLVLPERLDKHLESHWQRVEELVLAEARRLGLPARSVTPRFVDEEARRPDVPLNPDHLSVRGNEVVAEELLAGLRAAGLLTAVDVRPTDRSRAR